jgi:CheY-like chemotaxis protein
MSIQPFPFAVRLIGFSPEEETLFESGFAAGQGKGYRYFRLDPDNLQDPDIYVANAENLAALVTLADVQPSAVRPALLVGVPVVDLPYPRVARPLNRHLLFDAIDDLVERRTEALARLEASDIVAVPERRRRPRLDVDLTDPAEYERMRAKVPENGVVLVVDRAPALSDYLSDLLARQNVPVLWRSDEEGAADACKAREVAVVLINTSTPGVDPYRLCRAIKGKDAPVKTAVILLVSQPFVYDAEQGRLAGADGFLSKPLASHHLISVLKKFLPLGR